MLTRLSVLQAIVLMVTIMTYDCNYQENGNNSVGDDDGNNGDDEDDDDDSSCG